MNQRERRWLTVDKAAEKTDLRPYAIRDAINRGALKAVRIDSRIRIEESVLDAWMDAQPAVGES